MSVVSDAPTTSTSVNSCWIFLKHSPAHNNRVLAPISTISSDVLSAGNTLYRSDDFHKTVSATLKRKKRHTIIFYTSCSFFNCNMIRYKKNVYHFTLSTRELPTKSLNSFLRNVALSSGEEGASVSHQLWTVKGPSQIWRRVFPGTFA